MGARGLDGVLVTDRRQVHALSGYWAREPFPAALLLRSDGSAYLSYAAGLPVEGLAATLIPTQLNRLGTLVDLTLNQAIAALEPMIRSLVQIGSDTLLPFSLPRAPIDARPLLAEARRRKCPEEVSLIRHAIVATEAAYAWAAREIRAGMSEWEMYASLLQVSTQSAGEPIGELGNDFQSGTPGGPARHRLMEQSELLPLDLSVVFRGYSSDLCRTFAVGRSPSAAQRQAHQRVMEVLAMIEQQLQPGVSCRDLYTMAAEMLQNYRGWRFPHHLGHGIGITAHQAPRLNPEFNDVLKEGDVFTLEPGLYGLELRGGVRLEQNYLVRAGGVERLSSFPLDL